MAHAYTYARARSTPSSSALLFGESHVHCSRTERNEELRSLREKRSSPIEQRIDDALLSSRISSPVPRPRPLSRKMRFLGCADSAVLVFCTGKPRERGRETNQMETSTRGLVGAVLLTLSCVAQGVYSNNLIRILFSLLLLQRFSMLPRVQLSF